MTAMRMPLRVLIAEADAVSASLLVASVASMRGEPTVRWDAAGTWAALCASRFDLLVLDLQLGPDDGLDVLRRLRGSERQEGSGPWPEPKTAVVVVATASASQVQVKVLDAGADQYLVKPLNSELVAAVARSLLRRRPTGREASISPGTGLRLDLRHRMVTRSGNPVHLTPTQMEILVHLAQASPAAVRREGLMAACGSHGLSSSSLDFHIHHLRKQLGRHAIQTVRGGGFQLEHALVGASARTGMS